MISLSLPHALRVRHGVVFGLLFAVLLSVRIGPGGVVAASPDTTQPATTLTVDASKKVGAINPFVYGVNTGPWSMPGPDIMPAIVSSGLTYLRFPAGDWGDLNDLQPFQIDLFMDMARKMHAEPSISVRLKGGTPDAAAALVKAVNIDHGYGVRYWSIGNEPNLYPNYSLDQYIKDWRKFAEAMLAVDPTIIFVGPDISQYAPANGADWPNERNWLTTFLKANGDLVEIVSIHRYPFPQGMNDDPTTILRLKNSAAEWDTIIPDLRQDIAASAGHALPVAVTEVNSHWTNDVGGVATPDSFYHAIWWADVLGRMIRQQVDMVAYFTLNTAGNLGGDGLLSRYDQRPTYYVYQLYQKFGSEQVAASTTDPDVTVTAAQRSDGALTLMVVNPATDAKSVGLSLSGGSAAGSADLWRLDPDHNATQIGGVDLSSGTLDLPAQSVSLYVLQGAPATAQAATPASTQAVMETAPALAVATAAPTGVADNTALVYKDANAPVDQRVADLLGRMTLDEKIGQMTLVEKNGITADDITTLGIGGLLSGGGGYPDDNTPQGWADMVNGFQQKALASRLAIPMIYGADGVHGHNNLLGATIYPHNIGIGATRDAQLAQNIGHATAQEMIATGIYWNYAPVVAVAQDIRWGRTFESYSENTDVVSTLSSAFITGLQGTALGGPQSVLATPKHFVGDGGTKWGSSTTSGYEIDQGVTDVDEATLRAIHLPPYIAAIKAGAQSIMVSYSSWGGLKMSAQKHLMIDVLKGELGFKGFLVSDWMAIDRISADYDESVVTAINAGLDMIMVPDDYHKFISTLRDAVNRGDVPMSRIDDAVSRILRVKFMMGLFEHPVSDPSLLATVGSADHRALARQAVNESLVLLKNDANTLPLAKDTPNIFVAGDSADDIGIQSGGWTVEWQGITGSRVPGTSILGGIKQAVSSSTKVTYDHLGRFLNGKDAQGNLITADVGIVVVGEKPYAEGKGDKADLSLSAADVSLIGRVRARSKKLIVILVSGRPMIITDQLASADAFVAAWLPGSEGEGVADDLFGDKPFSGKLSFTWPRSMDQLPINSNNNTDPSKPLFPFGYGLTTK